MVLHDVESREPRQGSLGNSHSLGIDLRDYLYKPLPGKEGKLCHYFSHMHIGLKLDGICLIVLAQGFNSTVDLFEISLLYCNA